MTAPGSSRHASMSIALTFCVSFAVSFGYLYYKQRREEPALPPPPRVPAHSLRVPPPPPAAAVTAPLVEASLPPGPAVSVMNGGASSEPADVAQPDLVPVLVRVRRVRGIIEGNIKNLSEKPLSLTVVSRNRQAEETGQAVVMLAPFEMKNFGTDVGMELHSGDQILVQSQGFKDREAVAP